VVMPRAPESSFRKGLGSWPREADENKKPRASSNAAAFALLQAPQPVAKRERLPSGKS
jgi:hypothetical protein